MRLVESTPHTDVAPINIFRMKTTAEIVGKPLEALRQATQVCNSVEGGQRGKPLEALRQATQV